MASQLPSAAAKHALETLDMTVQGAKAYERDDLVGRLTGARRLLSDSTVTVHVVGEFKQGKSSLVNALLTAPICPVDDDIATAVPTEIRYAQQVSASASFESAPGSGGSGWTEAISPSEIATYASEFGNPGNTRRLTSVTVGIDRPLLSTGLVLVDTPGVGGLGSVTHAATVGTLPQSHAVLFLTDASQELTAAELRFLRTVRELCPTVLLLLTKVDLYPHWSRILELNAGHLRRAGVDVEVIPVSSELRHLAARTSDGDLNNESGFPVLVRRINEILAGSERIAVDALVTHIQSAVDQMEVTARAKRDALVDPRGASALVEELTATKERADALRERSSKWQLVLQDGFADISSDVEFDLRLRSRAVLHEAETAIEEGDPAKNWAEFEQWLRQRLAGEAMDNYALLVNRARGVAAAVGGHFELAAHEIVTPRVGRASGDRLADVEIDSGFVTRKSNAAGIAVFQKAAGGMLMFTMLPTLLGLAVPLPLGIAAGAVLGGQGFKEERKRALEKRRNEAKTAVRRFLDEFTLKAGKESRDQVRHMQRELRTAWTERVAELQRSAAETLAAAQAEAKKGESDADARSRIESDLASLGKLRARLDDLASHLERTRPARTDGGDPADRGRATPTAASR